MKNPFEDSNSESESQSSNSEENEQHTPQISSKKAKQIPSIIPRFKKNQIQEINTQIIVINISKTQYEVVETVAKELGWEVERSKKSEKWDVMWIDSHIEAHDLFKLNEHQKISHFPAIYVLTKKNFLGRSLMKMGKKFPQHYNFFPQTWNIPSDFNQLMISREKSQQKPIYIFKPDAKAQGKGIKLAEKIQDFQKKSGIVQVYINNPLLIENLKFDLRIYVLIMGYDPLRIFIYEQGLGRFATENYEKARKKNMKEVRMHLTNYAINKQSNKFIYNRSEKDMGKGHKRSLSAIYHHLSKMGIDTEKLKQKIDQVIIKTLIVGQPMIAHTYGLAQSDNYSNDLCFQILGFDILINENLQPILLEVNHTPSFRTDTPLDFHIKKNLIKDTLKLLNINVEKKKEMVNQKKQFIELRAKRKVVKRTNEEKQALRAQRLRENNEYESSNLGKFRKIFPSNENQKYKDLMKYSNKIFNEHYGFKNKNFGRFSYNNSRPNSNHSSPPNAKRTPPKIAKKQSTLKYAQTIELKKHMQNSETKLPSLKSGSKTKIRSYSGYMNKLKVQLLKDEHMPLKKQNLHIDPEALRINLLQKELSNKGNFLEPKIHDLKLKESFLHQGQWVSDKEQLSSEWKQRKQMKKSKKFEDVVVETTNTLLGLSFCKKMTYEAILNNLKKKQRHESKIISRKKY